MNTNFSFGAPQDNAPLASYDQQSFMSGLYSNGPLGGSAEFSFLNKAAAFKAAASEAPLGRIETSADYEARKYPAATAAARSNRFADATASEAAPASKAEVRKLKRKLDDMTMAHEAKIEALEATIRQLQAAQAVQPASVPPTPQSAGARALVAMQQDARPIPVPPPMPEEAARLAEQAAQRPAAAADPDFHPVADPADAPEPPRRRRRRHPSSAADYTPGPKNRFRLHSTVEPVGYKRFHWGTPVEGQAKRDQTFVPSQSRKAGEGRNPTSTLLADMKIQSDSNRDTVPMPETRADCILVIADTGRYSVDKLVADPVVLRALLNGWNVAPLNKMNAQAQLTGAARPKALADIANEPWFIRGRRLHNVSNHKLVINTAGLDGAELEQMTRVKVVVDQTQSEYDLSNRSVHTINSYARFLQYLGLTTSWPARAEPSGLISVN